MIAVELRDITKSFDNLSVLKNVNLSIEENSITVIYGAPISGKSVLIRIITGLEKPDSGQLFLRREEVLNKSPGARNIGYVPQSFALYPHYTVYDNIAYPLKLMKVPKVTIRKKVEDMAEQLKIAHLLQKYPPQLSGGEKQRVALARGIIKESDIFILDDPLAGLDFKLREQLFDDLRLLQESLNATFIYTTSNPLESLALADYVGMLDQGRIMEFGSVEEMYHRPKYVKTMELLGFPAANCLDADLFRKNGENWCRTKLFDFPVELDSSVKLSSEEEKGTIDIRPQDITFERKIPEDFLKCQAQILLRHDLGGELVVHLEANGIPLVAVISQINSHLISEDELTIGISPSAIALFSKDKGYKLGYGVM